MSPADVLTCGALTQKKKKLKKLPACVSLLRLLTDRMSGPCHSYSPAVVSEPPHPHLHSHSAAAAALRKAVFHSETPAVTFSSTSHPCNPKSCTSRNPAYGLFSLLFESETESRGSFYLLERNELLTTGSDMKYQIGE